MKRLGLTDFEHFDYHHLSGGLQKRLSFLVSLIQNPHILILDEISANVDPLLKRDICNILHEYHQSNGGIVIITSHDT